MPHTTSRLFCAIGFALVVAAPARAEQYGIANLTHADGGVTRQHGGAPAAATIGVSIMDGDLIHTTNARAEITFLDGTLVHLDRESGLLILAGDRVKMLAGRVSLRTSGSRTYIAEAAASKVHVQNNSVIELLAQAGRPDATIRVVSGKARIESPLGTAQVPDYHKAYLAGPSAAPSVSKVMPEPADDFERWALTRLVMASSTPLKGTEHGGGVAYAPYGYGAYGLYGYSAPYAYTYTYTRYYYPVTRYAYPSIAPVYMYSVPYYGTPYYPSSTSAYYGPTFYSSNYYASTPMRSFYGANINTESSYATPLSSRFTYAPPAATPAPTSSSPSAPVTAPPTAPAAAPSPGGAAKGVPVPKP